MNIHESIVVITSATTPIGRAIALHFAQLGASIALVDQDEVALYRVQKACLALNAHCESFVLQRDCEPAVIDLFDTIIQRFQRIDVLINTAEAERFPSLFGERSTSQFCHSLNKIGLHFFAFVKQAAEHMRLHDTKGVIVNLVLDNTHAFSQYDGTKALLSGLTHSWAEELAEFNIRVGGIVPLDLPLEMVGRDSQQRQYDWVRNAEYIVSNDSFNGRLLESAL